MYNFYQHLRDNLQEVRGIKFTLREIDVLSCVLHGRGSKKIAEVLSISPKTAEAHIRNIMLKVDCNSRESIIDYLEKSNELPILHNHYFDLIKAGFFTKQLTEIGKTYDKDQLACRLVYDFKNASHRLFFKEIGACFKLAGIQCIPEELHGSPNEATAPLTLCAYSVASLAAAWKPSHFLLPPGEGDGVDIKKISHEKRPPVLDFRMEDVAIPSFFSLLHVLIPQLDPQECMEKLHVNCDEAHSTSHRPQEQNQPSTQPPVASTTRNFKLATGIALSLAFLFPALFFTGVIEAPLFFSSIIANPPVRSELPIPNHATLLERPYLLDEVEKKLNQDLKGIRVVAIVGIGGSGKSTLAKRFGRQHKADVVWEINAHSSASIAHSFESLAYALAQSRSEKEELEAINKLKESAERDHQLLYFVRRHLEAKRDWLLIYDNLENFAEAHEHFPHNLKSWGDGKVIITTQNENLKNNSYLGKDNIIKIGSLDEAEKESLFQAILSDDLTSLLDEGTKTFLEHIPPFPLDVSICAYYLKNTEITPETYLQYMEESSEKFSAFQKRLLTDVSDYTKTRYGIITLSLDKLLQTHPEFLKPLLFISLLRNQNIPTYLMSHIQDEMTANAFIYNLKSYSLISPSASPLDSFSIHDSTQKIMLSYLEKRGILKENPMVLEEVAKDFIESLNKAGNSMDAIKMRAMITHAEQFLTHANLIPISLQGQAYGQLGRIYYYLGHYEQAEPHLQRSAEILGSHYGQAHPLFAWINAYLGKLYRNQGKYAKAEEFLQRSFQVYGRNLQECSLEYAWVAAHLGNIYRSLGYYEKGERLLRESLTMYQKELGQDHIKVARASVHLASILRAMEKYDEAYEVIKTSYPIFREHYGDDHALTAWVYTCLGRILVDLGQLDEAEEILKKSLQTYRKFFGADHIRTAWVLRGLGRLHTAKKNNKQAKEYLQQSLQILQKKDHSDAYISLELLAKLPATENETNGFASTTRQYLQDALDIVKTHFPESSPHRLRLSEKLNGEEKS